MRCVWHHVTFNPSHPTSRYRELPFPSTRDIIYGQPLYFMYFAILTKYANTADTDRQRERKTDRENSSAVAYTALVTYIDRSYDIIQLSAYLCSIMDNRKNELENSVSVTEVEHFREVRTIHWTWNCWNTHHHQTMTQLSATDVDRIHSPALN